MLHNEAKRGLEVVSGRLTLEKGHRKAQDLPSGIEKLVNEHTWDNVVGHCELSSHRWLLAPLVDDWLQSSDELL